MTNTFLTIQLSDTLLSILAVRSGELVDSIFGGRDGSEKQPELSSDLHSKLTSKTNGVHHMNGTSNGAVNGDARA